MAYGHRATNRQLASTPAGNAASVDTQRAAQRCPGFGDGIDPISSFAVVHPGMHGLSGFFRFEEPNLVIRDARPTDDVDEIRGVLGGAAIYYARTPRQFT